MTKEEITSELQRLKMLIDYEEAAERGYRHDYVAGLRQKCYTLQDQLKLLKNNDK